MAKILVIDRNEAFATMLKETLETEGDHRVHVAPRGQDGVALLARQAFDLTIIDLDQDRNDVDYVNLIKAARRLHPDMHIVLIPLMGEEVPADAHQLNIQGTISKPFFVDDLLARINDALSRPVGAAQPEHKPPAASPRLRDVLSELARETQADVVLLASTAGDRPRAIHHVSLLDEDHIQRLAQLVAETAKAGQAAAHFLGAPDEPYQHNMFENQDSRLYVMALPDEQLIAVVTSIHTPLGTIRHNLRRVSREIGGA